MSHSLVIPSRTTSRHSQISPSKSKINLFQQVTIKPSSNETTSSVTACRLSATYPSVSLLSSDSLLPHFLIVVSVVSRVVHGAHHHSPKMLKLETIVLALELSAYAHTAKGSSEPLTSKGGTSNDHLQVSESGLAHGSLRTLATRTLDSVSWILSLSILIDVNGYDGRKRTHVSHSNNPLALNFTPAIVQKQPMAHRLQDSAGTRMQQLTGIPRSMEGRSNDAPQ